MRTRDAVIFVVSSLIFTQFVQAAGDLDGQSQFADGGLCSGDPACIPCAGRALVVEETDADSGAVTRASLGELSAERIDNMIVLTRGTEPILTVNEPENLFEDRDLLSLADTVRTLHDICTTDKRDFSRFDQLARFVLLPRFVELGLDPGDVLPDGGQIGADAFGIGDESKGGGGFVLILVLFVLLVIVGAH